MRSTLPAASSGFLLRGIDRARYCDCAKGQMGCLTPQLRTAKWRTPIVYSQHVKHSCWDISDTTLLPVVHSPAAGARQLAVRRTNSA